MKELALALHKVEQNVEQMHNSSLKFKLLQLTENMYSEMMHECVRQNERRNFQLTEFH